MEIILKEIYAKHDTPVKRTVEQLIQRAANPCNDQVGELESMQQQIDNLEHILAKVIEHIGTADVVIKCGLIPGDMTFVKITKAKK